MHELVRAHIEDYLSRPESVPDGVTSHLKSCSECRVDMEVMASHSTLIRALRPEEQLEPRPGFYARVLDAIETQRPFSIWSIFLEPAFGPRLAIASAVIAVIMGVFLISGEPMNKPEPMQIEPTSIAAAVAGKGDLSAPALAASADQDQVRNAVFVSLATYRE